MRSLNVISALLGYPERELVEARVALIDAVRADTHLPQPLYDKLVRFIDRLSKTDLLDAQENYVALFDRGRSLSLLLFEHVHGESRDRGQAMVDLMAIYEREGFQINVRELPDYLPLFLEFLAQRPESEARKWLADVAHILVLLEERLRQRDSDYAVLFESLLGLAGIEIEQEREELRDKVAAEARDDTPEALDQVWEEEMVRFTENSAQECGDGVIAQRRRELDQVRPLHLQGAQPVCSETAGSF
ncbi:nitrate reductase molybdenum cofactor assembly chaperone NarJ [Marinobacterium zhoushanense]|uniref:Nitrate reductase molybdenum cofactor assembly chaperone NarJ n=1 Tax=Marinobacterium zhoushanense TaxID=1679163 RepID=A0ABQ1KG93_9GAMM|nr:nitrate reductase molybdenum cofactor assembly chaperone [Marinobacterium zhoushanense]GGB99253.1 nitrate reductase molybdenum cofactor assembly chaperone NarJ [Marinobacterium zhoushanense]